MQTKQKGFEYLAAAAWAGLAWMQIQAVWQNHSPLPLLLAAESLLVGYRLIWRRSDTSPSGAWHIRAAALGTVFLGPLLLQPAQATPAVFSAMSCAGVLLTIWALCSLGSSFGIAPADRGLVTAGPYRLIRHPMYAGALLNTLPVVLHSPSLWNILVFFLLVWVDVLRIRLEERTVSGYASYAAQVRWRLFPLVW